MAIRIAKQQLAARLAAIRIWDGTISNFEKRISGRRKMKPVHWLGEL
jgi:hypothetical protein